MIEFDAVYYDGKTSARNAVRVRCYSLSLHIVGPAVDIQVPTACVRVDPPVAGAPRSIHLPDGAQLQTSDQVALDALFPSASRFETWVHRLERRWSYALASVAIVAGFTWWCLTYGLPIAAQAVAAFVPVSLETQLGEHTLRTLDRSFCGPSKLDSARQGALRGRFTTLTTGLGGGYQYRLEFRVCGNMANAFALPGGTVVVTDELVKVAQNDEQVAAVLAHEIGHVMHRHGLRTALQAAGLAALIGSLAGDAVSITGLAVTLPTMLLQTGYSREFEEEADDYAFQRLKQVGLSPKYFAEMMARLEEHRTPRAASRADEAKAGRPLDYLSTHPPTARRIERALTAQ